MDLVCIEAVRKSVLGIHLSEEREKNMFAEENFICSFVSKYGKHVAYSDGGTWYPLQACNFLYLKYILNSSLEKSLIERVMQYFKDRIESFDDYYPCTGKVVVIYNMNTIGSRYSCMHSILLSLQQTKFHFL